MDDRVSKLYRLIMNKLDDKEKEAFRNGFILGVSEGIAQCAKQLDVLRLKK
ncbi:hypothetical protein LCGC14_2980240 [marine sediment metagenome]|uniref:Uncharacterized protein n=1 Tax=marine sediment metagenome TaxID=412755 RepID=A0A0F8X7N9_9ZZZZ